MNDQFKNVSVNNHSADGYVTLSNNSANGDIDKINGQWNWNPNPRLGLHWDEERWLTAGIRPVPTASGHVVFVVDLFFH